MMDDINISRATSTSQISSLALGHHRLSSSAASIPSSSSSASSFRGVPDDHWARQLIFPPFPGHRPPAISHPTAAADVNTAAAPPALDPGSLFHGGAKITTDFEHYDCESEEGEEISEEQKRPPPRSGSKRSRAAEVHNLSEKRRRSRINEKMKALQNLIPNSNKTDKASMLDEAIEYLKQLQLQVQMLSMRNGLNLQTMYLPGTMPALQSSHIRMGLNPDDASLINMAVGMMPSSHDSSVHQSPFEISKQMMSNVPAIPNPVASLGIDSSQFNSFPFPLPGEVTLEPSRLLDGEDDGGSSSGAFPGGSQQLQGGIHAGKHQWKDQRSEEPVFSRAEACELT